jgi:hypothetical protein
VSYVRGGSRPVAVMRADEAATVLRDLFPQAQLETGHPGPLRVVLERAGATLGRVGLARTALAQAGLGVVVGSSVDDATTTVFIPEESEVARRAGVEAATALGLPATVVRVDPAPDAVVDVRIVLGSDYDPV